MRPETVPPWHALAPDAAVALLEADSGAGLSADEARRRLQRVGPNRVGETPERPLWRLALDQLRSLVVLLLIGASALAATLGETLDALAIAVAVALNAAIGFASEWRARVSLSRLRALAVPRAVVRRGGRVVSIAAANLVPGDLLVLEAGSHVAADARLLRSAALRTDESALTGESTAVEKDAAAPVAAAAALADRRTMVYLGTAVVGGSGLALVTATGLATELGRIGQLVALSGERETPLERQVEQLGRRLLVLGLATCATVAAAGILHGLPVTTMLATAATLAVAAVPEGLPAVTAVALAAGVYRLSRIGALVRRLPAVETLGSTTVICSDKTGTITENQMAVRALHAGGRSFTLDGGARSSEGSFREGAETVAPASWPPLRRLLETAALVNDASVSGPGDALVLQGDPTESALLVAARKAGLDPAALARARPRRSEIPFDPSARFMVTLHERGAEGPVALAKGAPDLLIGRAARVDGPTGPVPLDEPGRASLRAANDALADRGLRILAVAFREGADGADPLDDLTLIGLVGLVDPVREGVREAIEDCRTAGIRTLMLTGDQRVTAEAVGRELGLAPEAVFSRVSPEQKLSLIESLQGQGEVVAMTGDGVNDAPALARADIGVAMGRHGTDVAREAADLVLTDDAFPTIVHAVREGRVVYENLRKVMRFLFSTNVSEILVVFAAIAVGFPAPLLPVQILWVNLVTDALPALALVRDPADPHVMRRPPRDPAEGLVTGRLARQIGLEGALLAAGVLSAFAYGVWTAGPGPRASTLAFVAMVLIQPLQALRCRSERGAWWRGPSNPLLLASLAAIFALQVLAVSWASLALVLGTAPLAATDWAVALAAILWPAVLLDVVSALQRGLRRPAALRSPGRRSARGPGPS